MRWLGRFANSQTVRFLWNTQQLGGASVTRSSDGAIRIYRDGSLIQRPSSSGITDTENFDGMTGVHLCEIDLSDSQDVVFYNLGRYQVVVAATTVGGAVCNVPIAHFEVTEAGGGETPDDGTNPDDGFVPADQPQVFITIEPLDNSASPNTFTFVAAESRGGPFADNADYFGGWKEARILSISPVRRAYTTTEGGLQLSSWTITLDDTDRALRGMFGVTNLFGQKCSIYVIDHPDRINELEPYRVAAGIIVNDGAEPDFTYKIEVEGMFGRHTSTAIRDRVAPPTILTPDVFPTLLARWADGWVPPIGYGALSDEAESSPQGVVPGIFIAEGNLSSIGGINQNVLAFAFFGHAIQDTLNIYYNPEDQPDVRSVVPFAEYGNNIWAPHKPGWSETGQAGEYVDVAGFRLTIVFVNADIGAQATALREGRITLTGNFHGIEDVGDATGLLIDKPASIVAHFWTNFVDNAYQTGTWTPQYAVFGNYSQIDHDRVEAANAYSDSLIPGGLKGAILIGRDGRSEPLFDVLKEMASSWDLNIGENNHGQIVIDYEDTNAEWVYTFTDQQDSIQLRTDRNRQAYANSVTCKFGYRYAPPAAPTAAPAAGDPLPTQNTIPTASWTGEASALSLTGIDAFNGHTVLYTRELYGVRDSATAAALASRFLNRFVGPELSGPLEAQHTTGWQGAGFVDEEPSPDENVPIDIGTMIALDHAEGWGANGFDGRRILVREMSFDVLNGVVTHGGRVMEEGSGGS